jgi:hypothetical protein
VFQSQLWLWYFLLLSKHPLLLKHAFRYALYIGLICVHQL